MMNSPIVPYILTFAFVLCGFGIILFYRAMRGPFEKNMIRGFLLILATFICGLELLVLALRST